MRPFAYLELYLNFSTQLTSPDPVGTALVCNPQKTDLPSSGRRFPPDRANSVVSHNFQKKCA